MMSATQVADAVAFALSAADGHAHRKHHALQSRWKSVMVAQLGVSIVCSYGSVSRFRKSAAPFLMIGDRPMYSRKQDVRNMINALQSELTINVVASIIVSLLFLALGFLWGKYKEQRRKLAKTSTSTISTRSLSRAKLWRVQPERFSAGDALLPQNEDHTAARQLISSASKTMCGVSLSRPNRRLRAVIREIRRQKDHRRYK